MYFNPEVYHYNNLNDTDKALIDLLENAKANILTKDTVDEFIETKNVSGATLQEIYRDVLTEFVGYLTERVEYFKVDVIIDKIDSYQTEERK